MEKAKPKISRRTVLKWGAAGVVAGTGIGLLGNEMEITQRTLRLPKWKADGFRIAQVSDVHVIDDAQLASAKAAIRVAMEAKPDLIVFTGDFVNHDKADQFANIPKAFEELADARCPCLAIFGNHDHWCGAPEKVEEAAKKTKLNLLINRDVDVEGVRVVGLDSGRGGKPDYSLVTAKDAASTLVLLHEPDYLENFATPAGLVLSGHSHGGEMCLPGGIAVYTPRGSRRYRSGYYPNAPTPVYVNRGTATLGPARLYCPTEVCIFTLQSA
ncbi:hypothetical protein EON80_24310 [bacterium]|nr:MAG: hypothetical protein EON80_24310 [bacterium]